MVLDLIRIQLIGLALIFQGKEKKRTHPKAVTLDDLTGWLNVKAMMANAGKRGGKYSGFKDFKNVN